MKSFTLAVQFILVLISLTLGESIKALDQETGTGQVSLRRAEERGFSSAPWLKSYHSFSFGEYRDPKYQGFHTLKVINEDTIKGGSGFDWHPHKEMEIITYVIKGALDYQDSLGNKTIVRAGEVERVSAGSGIEHAVYNHDKNKSAHFYQIWVLPKTKGVKPSYEQKSFDAALKDHQLVLVLSKNGHGGSMHIDQDLELYIGRLTKNETLGFRVQPHHYIWLQMVKGKITVNGNQLSPGDGLRLKIAKNLEITALDKAEFMLFDMT